MKFKQYDIENSKSHLLKLINERVINLDISKLDLFMDFIIENFESIKSKISPEAIRDFLITFIKSLSNEEIEQFQIIFSQEINDETKSINKYLIFEAFKNINDSICETLKRLDISDIVDLHEKFIKEEDEFHNLISKSFQFEKRRQLKINLIKLDTEYEEIAFNDTITKAFQFKKREELKNKLTTLEVETKGGKVVSMRQYLKAISVAASIILILVVWQPQHISDNKLFASYSSNLDNRSINDFTQAERIKEQGGLRGEEEHFRNYTYNQTLQLLEAIALIKQNDFEKAKEVFNRLHVEKEKNPGLALYLSIAQLNTDNLDDAITNLVYLTKLPSFPYQDETKFHLAYAYLKSGERKKTKVLLNELVQGKSKFSDHAQKTLKKIRWF